jgi:type IV pilus assembly protein PilW
MSPSPASPDNQELAVTIPHTRQALKRRAGGFSLVEIMVGIALGIVGALVIMQVSAIFEGRKRTTTSGADAQINGALALHTIERDVRKAGYGISVPDAIGCTVRRYFGGAEITAPAFSLTPVVITKGAGGRPDTIRTIASSKDGWSVPNRITSDHPAAGSSLFLNTTLGMEAGDMLVAYQPGRTCTLMQATEIDSADVEVVHATTSPWNPDGASSVFPVDGYSVGGLVFNFGSLSDRTYSIDANSNLMLTERVSATNTDAVRALASDIVNLKAEYGFDTRAGKPEDLRVDSWSGAMIDADNSGTAGDSGDIGRIAAVRMAVVARSAVMERPKSDGTCDITISTAIPGRTPNSPTWAGGAIDVSRNPDGTPNPNWQCHRYKVYETVIPLRNLLWREP